MVPFGLTNAPATFTCHMNNVFNKFMDNFVLVFLDEILIYSKNEEEHKEHLRMELKFIREQKLYEKLSNVTFIKIKFIIWVTLSQKKEYLWTLRRLMPL